MSNFKPVNEKLRTVFLKKGVPESLIPSISSNYKIAGNFTVSHTKKPKNNVMILGWGMEVKDDAFVDAQTFYKGRYIGKENLIEDVYIKQIKSDVKKRIKSSKLLDRVFFYNFLLRPMKLDFHKKIKNSWFDQQSAEEVKKMCPDDFELDIHNSAKLFKEVIEKIVRPNAIIILGNSLKNVVEDALGFNLEECYKNIAVSVIPYSYCEIGFQNGEKDILVRPWLTLHPQGTHKYEEQKKDCIKLLKDKYSKYCYPISSILSEELANTGCSAYMIYCDRMKKWINAFNITPLKDTFSSLLRSVEIMLEKNVPKPTNPTKSEKARQIANKKRKEDKKLLKKISSSKA